jgi:hypothetical protein
MSGQDVYRIASSGTSSTIAYVGTERLTTRRDGKDWRFEAHAQYARSGPDGLVRGQAFFVQVLEPNGTFEDRADDDPDFLSILNQPFAVRLDPATLSDVRSLKGRVPFAATSPLGAEAVLHGFLRPAKGGAIAGRPTAAVRFEAEGAMTGPLPGYAETLVSGTMRMDGTAYYALEDATLLALDVNLHLDAQLAQSATSVTVPVRIDYRRWIRATGGAATTRLRAQPAKGAATAAPATP